MKSTDKGFIISHNLGHILISVTESVVHLERTGGVDLLRIWSPGFARRLHIITVLVVDPEQLGKAHRTELLSQ